MSTRSTVYIVDDDAAMRRSTSMLLEGSGLFVRTFESGPAFLSEVTPDASGCLILDLHMPEMTGVELFAVLRRRGFTMPALLVSGTGTKPAAMGGDGSQLFDFLLKPVDPDVLISTVRSALKADASQRGDGADPR